MWMPLIHRPSFLPGLGAARSDVQTRRGAAYRLIVTGLAATVQLLSSLLSSTTAPLSAQANSEYVPSGVVIGTVTVTVPLDVLVLPPGVNEGTARLPSSRILPDDDGISQYPVIDGPAVAVP